MVDDEILVQRFLSGDVEAFNQLVRNWERPLYSFVYRFVGEREASRDVCQEVFTIAFRKIEGLKEKNRFSAWIYKIALNQCRIRHREQRGKTAVSLDAPPEDETGSARRIDMADSQISPEEQLSRKEIAERVRAALETIPPDQRAVIIMKEYQGLKFNEIAEILECPISTVKSRMYFGLQALEKALRRRPFDRTPMPRDEGP